MSRNPSMPVASTNDLNIFQRNNLEFKESNIWNGIAPGRLGGNPKRVGTSCSKSRSNKSSLQQNQRQQKIKKKKKKEMMEEEELMEEEEDGMDHQRRLYQIRLERQLGMELERQQYMMGMLEKELEEEEEEAEIMERQGRGGAAVDDENVLYDDENAVYDENVVYNDSRATLVMNSPSAAPRGRTTTTTTQQIC